MIYESQEGDPSIYTSPQIEKSKSTETPKDLSFEDNRGRINFLDINGVKVHLQYTKKGFRRGGDLHKNTQYNAIISGKVKITTLENNKEVENILDQNSFVIIKPHVPHLFEFLEDTVMAEWWDGPFQSWYFKPFRNLVKN